MTRPRLEAFDEVRVGEDTPIQAAAAFQRAVDRAALIAPPGPPA